MDARQRTIAALQGRQPDEVPHFELEMQLTEEYFGRHFVSPAEWDAAPAEHAEHLRRDAQLFVDIADRFDYGVIFYSWMHRPGFDDYREGLRVLAELNRGKRLLMAHGDATPSIPSGSDMDRVIVDMMLNPDKVKAEVDRAVDGQLERVALLKQDGLDGVALCADYCFNSGPFLSPVMFSDIITPRLTRLTQAYRAMGLWTIKHTDGNIMPILEDLIQSGPHALHSLDPMAGVDIAEVKRRTAGKLCLMGNVNCALMQTGTDEEVLASCRHAMESGKPGGGYIFSTSNVIFQGMPRERDDLIWDFWKKNCKY
jgi:uroporphyrinogen decarboxylase